MEIYIDDETKLTLHVSDPPIGRRVRGDDVGLFLRSRVFVNIT
jgi:hypothetical protein